ncbi:putative serine threonine protein kinase domain protein [Erysiphe necator]|uniref:Putative serine threonine protein kinase domain protein n=1 Tax=Uncinula necator TaxID=52586 RepID=A0A0B1P207_UNCNE|nr:putative serine threonine protein kinase domain protein [Erysiphe necator]
MPGQRNRILSVAQLEKQGFSIQWPSHYRDMKLVRSDQTICAIFRRINGRFISVNRDWHSILGHPGQKAQDAALKSAGIAIHKFPLDCEICTKVKITKSKGYGSLRQSSSIGEIIHMDLVGGQKSLTPTITDKSIPNATWFLLAVDNFTAWKWAWPVYSKKTVPGQIGHSLEHLKNKFDKTPKCIHTDSGTGFSNSEFQDLLLSCGIEWQRSFSHAPEQNGIVERNFRTITEKMRALHLQSGLQLRQWPLILKAAINILNITPNTVSLKSSYFAVFQKFPKINHLHPFGCRAFWLEPDQNKLQSKAKGGVYVGTEFSGCHIILNPDTNRTVVRRDVRMHENCFPLKTSVLSLQANNRNILQSSLNGPRVQDWNKAIDKKMENMKINKVWILVPRSGAMGKIMTGKWALKEK